MPDAGAIAENTLEVIAPDRSSRVVRISGSPFLIGRGEEAGNHLPLDVISSSNGPAGNPD